ncbi:SH3 domain-containing protein [Streptomyces sp. RS10V-4]|uniref:SH3 domain-containing protein n=1 Tax=Streptomyces rhizoryzae TaxID=2932493 RepID=UPI0020047193|nr:SH3 domain-containing protein [Streptomyces rhizoryzae]MCK7626054.1 SH3 domain-containing protein [Streptomyces rhizoryzae]
MKHLSQIRRGAAVVASAGLLCGVLGTGPAAAAGPPPSTGGHGPYHGRVIAKPGLVLRTGPGTGYRAVGSAPYGTVVTIVCKVNGQNVGGNPRWYKLDARRNTWGSARYISTLGAAPAWCDARTRR